MSCNKNNSLTQLNKLNRELFRKIKSKYSKYNPEYVNSRKIIPDFDPSEGEYSVIYVGEEEDSRIEIRKYEDNHMGIILICQDGYILVFIDKELKDSYNNIYSETELFKKIDSMIKISENLDSAPKYKLI